MLARLVRVIALGSLLFALATPSAAMVDPLQPGKPWVIDYAEAQCVASRQYGSGGNLWVLAIRPAPNGETYELLLGRNRSGPEFAEEAKGSVDFGNGPIRAWLLHYGGERKSDVYQFRISAADMSQGRAAKTVRLRAASGPDVTLTLSLMSDLLDGLDKCTVDLKHYWNMESPDDAKIATKSKGSLVGVFSDRDYPSEALQRGQQGASQFLLLIDEKGSVAGCHVLKASGVPALDGMGCVVIKKRMKLSPALDAQGHPIRSTVVTPPIKWVM